MKMNSVDHLDQSLPIDVQVARKRIEFRNLSESRKRLASIFAPYVATQPTQELDAGMMLVISNSMPVDLELP